MEENDNKEKFIKSLNLKSNYVLILTEDSFLLLEKLENGIGKIVFWSSLFAMTDLQLNKSKKITTINFFDDESDTEYQLKLRIDNILLFRDSLVKKMRSLKVKVNSQKLIKLIKGQHLNRLTEKEIRNMEIKDIEKNTKELKERIDKGEINDYTVNTFTTLCGRAIEYFSSINDPHFTEYMDMMKAVLSLEGVDKLTKDNEKEIKENSEI